MGEFRLSSNHDSKNSVLECKGVKWREQEGDSEEITKVMRG